MAKQVPCGIASLHKGMNLRDVAQAMEPGETGLSVGCDFSEAGVVRPMRQEVMTDEYDDDINYGFIAYVDGVKYLLTSHDDGLRVRAGADAPVLIDSDITGKFYARVINSDWIAILTDTVCRKWKPGWTQTYQWGLNTPPAPTLSTGNPKGKAIENFEDLALWSFTGGGGAGALAADTTNYRNGQGMKLTCSAGATIIATTPLDANLNQIDEAGDVGVNPCFNISIYTPALGYISSIGIKLSCAPSGSFTDNYYSYTIRTEGNVPVTLAHVGGEMYPVTDEVEDEDLSTISGKIGNYFSQSNMAAQWDPTTQKLTVTLVKDSKLGTYLGTDVVEDDAGTIDFQQYVLQSKKRRTYMKTGWTDIKIPLSEFIRTGTGPYTWATITAMEITVTAVTATANVTFDDCSLTGGGDLWGFYWVAVAYQNELGNYGPYTDFVGPVYTEADPLLITELTPDTDPQTISRRIAILGGSATDPMVTHLDDNTSDLLLYYGGDTALITVEKSFNNSPPTPGRSMAESGGRIFIAGPNTNRNHVIYSESEYYEAFPTNNYRIMSEREELYQIARFGNLLAIRGKWREWLMSTGTSEPSLWHKEAGAREGAVTNDVLLDLGAGQVFMCEKGFYLSSPGVSQDYYLTKINDIIANPQDAMGAIAGKKAYIYFRDTSGVDWIMRIDYTLGIPVAHYVKSVAPSSIIFDQIEARVYYSYQKGIYELDAGTNPLPTTLVIPGQYCSVPMQKAFVSLVYELENGPLSFTLRADRKTIPGTFTLPDADGVGDPKALPFCEGRALEITLTSTTEDYSLYLPMQIEAYPVAN